MPPSRRASSLTEGPIAKSLLLFALPILGGTVLQSLNASVNAMWIGHFLGEKALSATSNASLFLMLLLSAVFGLSMASTILIGQSLGAKDLRQAKRVVGTGVGFFATLSILIAALGWWGSPWLLALLNTPPDAQPLAIGYLRVIFLALPAMYLYGFLMMTLRGAGDSKTPFLFMGLGVLLDVGLNPLLILGVGPLPRMGIAGAATATLISQNMALLALLATLYARGHFLCLRRGELAYLRPDPTILRALIFKGLPMGLQMIVISSSSMLMMGLVNHYGSRAVAAYGAATQLWVYVQMPALAIGSAVSAMAAQNIGARRWDRIRQITWAGVRYNLLLTGALVIAIYAFDRQALQLFLAGNGAAINQAAHLNQIAIGSFVFSGVTFVLFGVVRATGAVWPPMLILLVSLWLIRPPFAWWLQARLGADAIWWSFPLGSLASMLMATAYYRWGTWRRSRMLGTVAGPAPAHPPRQGSAEPALALED